MKKVKKLKGLRKRNAISGYLFILPFIVGFLAFMVKPFFQSLYMSFCNVELGAGSFKMGFAGIANYLRAFTAETEFNRLLAEEIWRMSYNALAIMVFSQKFKGRAFVRAVFFLPVILSSGVILGIEYDNSLLASVQDTIQQSTGNASITGVIEEILMTSGIGGEVFDIVFEIVSFWILNELVKMEGMLAKAIVSVFVIIINYVLSKIFVFKSKK